MSGTEKKINLNIEQIHHNCQQRQYHLENQLQHMWIVIKAITQKAQNTDQDLIKAIKAINYHHDINNSIHKDVKLHLDQTKD